MKQGSWCAFRNWLCCRGYRCERGIPRLCLAHTHTHARCFKRVCRNLDFESGGAKKLESASEVVAAVFHEAPYSRHRMFEHLSGCRFSTLGQNLARQNVEGRDLDLILRQQNKVLVSTELLSNVTKTCPATASESFRHWSTVA